MFVHQNNGRALNKRFLELHFMIGAILLQNKQYDWIDFMLTYDQTTPPNYYLVPGTISKIYSLFSNFEELMQMSHLITSIYQMRDTFHDKDSDKTIITWAYRYAALLFERIASGCAKPPHNRYEQLQLDLPNTIQGLQTYKKISIQLLTEHEVFWTQERINKMQSLEKNGEESAKSLLEQIKNNIEEKLNYIQANPTVDPLKLVGLREELCNKDNGHDNIKTDFDVYNDNSVEEATDIKQLVTAPATINKLQCTKEYQHSWSNFPDVVINHLYNNVVHYVCRKFSEFKINKDIQAIEKTLFNVLDSLNINKEYVIVSFGVMMDVIDRIYNKERRLTVDSDFKRYYNGAPVLQYNIYEPAMYILK